jgi:hypothetical protein
MKMEFSWRSHWHIAIPSKDWKSLFPIQKHEKPPKEKAWVQSKRRDNAVGEDWEIFWRNTDYGGSMNLFRRVGTYCRDVSFSDLKSANHPCPPIQKSARIDGYGTVPDTALSAPELYQLLTLKV